MGIKELVLEESQILVGYDFDTESVFHLPLAFQGDDCLVHIGGHVRMDMKGNFLNDLLVAQIVDRVL